jgi:hypothetical protein
MVLDRPASRAPAGPSSVVLRIHWRSATSCPTRSSSRPKAGGSRFGSRGSVRARTPSFDRTPASASWDEEKRSA